MNSDGLTIMDHVCGWLSQRRWGFVGRWWRKRQRRIDRDVLFPAACWNAMKDRIGSGHPDDLITRSHMAMALHIYVDWAWRFRDEWADEPEAEWYDKARQEIGKAIFGQRQETAR